MQAVGARRKIDRSLPVPLHFQIRALLIEMIERGEVVSGQPLAPEKELADRYGVSLSPIRQAILDLVKEGVLYRRPGSGTFLREPPRTERISVLGSFIGTTADGLAVYDLKQRAMQSFLLVSSVSEPSF